MHQLRPRRGESKKRLMRGLGWTGRLKLRGLKTISNIHKSKMTPPPKTVKSFSNAATKDWVQLTSLVKMMASTIIMRMWLLRGI